MKKLLKMLIFLLVLIPVINVSAADYEAKLIVKGTTPSDTEFYYETVEEAFAAVEEKETEYKTVKNVYLAIQLLDDVEVSSTLTAKTTKLNFQLDVNGKNITSTADPVIELKVPISGIVNISEEPCSILQKDITDETVSTTTPHTIVSLPQGCMSTMLSATNVTFGDGTGTAVNSKVMMPLSVSDGIYLGKMELAKPMFLSAVTGGLFDQDPTAHIDTNAYEAVLNKDNLYEIREYISARVLVSDGTIVKKYSDIQKSFEEMVEGEEIQILKQSYPTETVTIDEDEDILIDFHGFQVTGAGSKTAALSINSNIFIKNLGKLTLTSKTKQTSTNFVFDEPLTTDFVSTIQNKGTLNIKGLNVYVNYNHPGRDGNIFAITNDSSEADALLYIDEKTVVGGLRIEPEDPATGKYPAIYTTGSGYTHENVVNLEYYGKDKDTTEDNDNIIFMVEDTVITDVIYDDVFDDEGNFNTQMYLNNGIDLQKKNIVVKKDGVVIDFEYDSTTDELTIPASNFTDGKDTITINYQHYVTYMVDGEVLKVDVVDIGTDSVNPDIPEKDGYTAKWNGTGKNIFEDTVITAVYTAVKSETDEILPPKTGDTIALWYALLIGSVLTLTGTYIYKKYN